jgi:hypothetical protein
VTWQWVSLTSSVTAYIVSGLYISESGSEIHSKHYTLIMRLQLTAYIVSSLYIPGSGSEIHSNHYTLIMRLQLTAYIVSGLYIPGSDLKYTVTITP